VPSSNLALAPDVLALVNQAGPRTVLDIGPGNGKYALLIREYLNDPPEVIDAIEAEPSYVARFPWLACLYDDVRVGDGAALTEEELAGYDLVMLLDVIEHIEHDRALKLLDRCAGRVAIVTPVDYFKQHVEGVPSEDHISHWTLEEFRAMPRFEVGYENLGGIVVLLGPR